MTGHFITGHYITGHFNTYTLSHRHFITSLKFFLRPVEAPYGGGVRRGGAIVVDDAEAHAHPKEVDKEG